MMGLAVAVVAGACSGARSLVQLNVDVKMDALAAAPSDAQMRIDLVQGGHPIHATIAERLDQLRPQTASATTFQIGIFLDRDVSGMVTVRVTIIDNSGCQISDTDTVEVTVTAGKASPSKDVMIHIQAPNCPGDGSTATQPPADGGSDAAEVASAEVASNEPDGPAADSATDASTDDAGGGEVYCPPDAGVEALPPPTCDEFCGVATKKCPAYYADSSVCLAACMEWKPGVRSDKSVSTLGENTIGCRLYFASRMAAATATADCAAAAPNSTRCLQ